MSERFDQVVEIMARLRGEGGCPWDRKQTRESLKPYLVEEAYEVLETIEAQDDPKLKEELGDVLLQILFHAEIGRERSTFTIEDVLETLADKLIRRHPHVFGEKTNAPPEPLPAKISAEEVVHRWEEIKRQEKADQSGNGDAGSALDGVPKSLPALLRAYQLQVRAARIGFDWPHDETGYAQVVNKVHEELREVEEARADVAQDATEAARRRLQDEVGDILFALVNLARVVKVNPEEALRGSANRFATRFTHMEQAAKSRGHSLSEMTLAEMDRLWDEAKTAEGNKAQP
ncbi:MAG: nucleoside triphosphate pyrophosphohydrolase [Nitrospirae bacterium]|nr:nucleoside triphosphate pyrophosphohydrolase [Nitrospirota bacterium]